MLFSVQLVDRSLGIAGHAYQHAVASVQCGERSDLVGVDVRARELRAFRGSLALDALGTILKLIFSL